MTKTDYILSLNIKGGESPGIMPPACTFSRDTSGKSHGNNIIIIMLYIETADTEHFASHREKSAAKQSLFKAFVKRPYSA